MTTDAEDRSTWPRNRQVIRRDELLRLIEEHDGPAGLDLRGANFVGDWMPEEHFLNPIDLSSEALKPLAEAYRRANHGSQPPWLEERGGIRLVGTQLQGANLGYARLQRANLWHAQLQRANLWHAQLQEAELMFASLANAILDTAQLQGAQCLNARLQEAYLRNAQLHEAYLRGARLQGAMLESARLDGADLTGAQLQGAMLDGALLDGADLTSAQLQGTDMYNIAGMNGARWYGAVLNHTRMRRESLGKVTGDDIEAHGNRTAEAYSQATEAYLLLKNNFNQIGRYEDASWAYVKEQQMEKMAHYWEWRSHGWQVWRAWGSFWRWLRNWAYELATGYGERPWNPVIGGVLFILGFAMGFTRAVGNFWDALIYSVATFATFNLADTGPTGRGADVASSVEALLGIAVLALVVFTLGNKMSRG
jgi:uncharacterized protein YjbI with pentapeptide repeats